MHINARLNSDVGSRDLRDIRDYAANSSSLFSGFEPKCLGVPLRIIRIAESRYLLASFDKKVRTSSHPARISKKLKFVLKYAA